MEKRRAEQIELVRVRKASWEAESGLDGLWARRSYSETTRYALEDLLNGYARAFKLQPSRSEGEEWMEKDNESPIE